MSITKPNLPNNIFWSIISSKPIQKFEKVIEIITITFQLFQIFVKEKNGGIKIKFVVTFFYIKKNCLRFVPCFLFILLILSICLLAYRVCFN